MNIYTLYTESHRQLFEQFAKALPENFRLHAKFFDGTQGSTFGTPEFAKAVYGKVHFLRDVVSQMIGKNIVYLDVDVIVARDFEATANEILATSDFAFQDNGAEWNVGVWMIKCTPIILEFFDDLCAQPPENFATGSHDQSVINNLLRTDKWKDRIRVSVLPNLFYDAHHDYSGWQSAIPSGCFLFHATNCNLSEKMGKTGQFINTIKLKTLNDRLARSFDLIRNFEIKMAIKTRLRIISILPFAQTALGPNGVTFSEVRRVRFVPSPSNSDSAIEKFRKDIPEAAIELSVADSTLWPEFEVDKDYWVDFTPV